MKSVIDYSWKLCVLNEGNFINVVLLVAPHEQILVQILEIRFELLHNKLSINGSIIVFHMNEIIIINRLIVLILIRETIELSLVH